MAPDVTDLRAFGEDTSPSAERFLIEAYRRMTPSEKLRCATDLYEAAWAALRAVIRAEAEAGVSDREVELRIAGRFHGRTLIDAVRRAQAGR